MTSDIRSSTPVPTTADPTVPDWASLSLPETWADRLNLKSVAGLVKFFRLILGKPQRVQVDQSDPLFANIPRYALQEFHNLPNGNYSSRISRGYITGFDPSMLGFMQATRRAMAARVVGSQAVLDIGTGGGKLAAQVHRAGVADVWGVDVSPYMLKHAASDYPEVAYLQAPVEQMPFASERFDAVVACFLFHELPPKYAEQALAECHRVLRPGGQLLIAEPSENQLQPVRLRSLFSRAGWRHWYFKTLARFVYEPFVMAWHNSDKPAMFARSGFQLLEHKDEIPINFYALRKN
ncbi:class I SAM-dependent methyltransferase [Gilvimarinus agarilyticus]|uniref:class I SAM-dependent methyltransferase n=1 Tax=Gilvimarinus agarilyticus TaxID=679259 RepID=UPI000A06E56E|nr:class I SAM-dependent methyltransferase [Gilvimarinus agarilyticus]